MYGHACITATAAVVARQVSLMRVTLTAGADAASISLYDHASANTNLVAVVKAPINTTISAEFNVACRLGVYAVITGTAPTATVVYR